MLMSPEELQQAPPLQLDLRTDRGLPEARLSETDVGMTAFRSPQVPGFRGIVKHRYSDFLVYEIDESGQVLHLTDPSIPEELMSAAAKRERDAANNEGGEEEEEDALHVDVEPMQAELEELLKTSSLAFSVEDAEAFGARFTAFVEGAAAALRASQTKTGAAAAAAAAAASSSSSAVLSTDTTFEFPPTSDKQVRTQLHKFVRKYAGHVLATDLTQPSPDSPDKAVQCHILDEKTARREKKKWNRTEDKIPPFVHFLLYKENSDTISAVNTICRATGLKSKIFSYAGTKDKRGVTVQRISVRRTLPERIVRGLKAKDSNNRSRYQGYSQRLLVGNFRAATDQLHLGELNGNYFEIVLRNVDVSDAELGAAAEALSQRGFINYFGMQRFGTGSVPTHRVGIALLNDDFKEAVSLLLLPPRESDDSRQEPDGRPSDREVLLELAETSQIGPAVTRLSFKRSTEKKLLCKLAKSPNDFAGAFQILPRNLRSLFVNSVQSFIWNEMATVRLTKLDPDRPLVGDLVFARDADSRGNVVLDGDDVEMDDAEGGKPLKQQVAVLTEADIASGEYTIEDVVLPLPGTGTRMPANEMQQHYAECVQRLGLSLSHFTEVGRHPDIQTRGYYRPLLVKPGMVSWNSVGYSDSTRALVPTDRTRLQGNDSTPNEPDAPFRAMICRFSLPPGTYATVCLRELTKGSTDYATQKELSRAAFERESSIAAAAGAASAAAAEE